LIQGVKDNISLQSPETTVILFSIPGFRLYVVGRFISGFQKQFHFKVFKTNSENRFILSRKRVKIVRER
jgi:hypothetical protein